MLKRLMSMLVLILFLFSFAVFGVAAEGKVSLSERLLSDAVFYQLDQSEDGSSRLITKDYLGNEVSLPYENLEMPSFFSAETLPSSYDLRQQKNASERTLSTSVKHQGFSDFCWAFAASASAESSVLKQNLEKEEDLSNIGGKNELAFSPVHLGQTAFYPVEADGISGDYFYSAYAGSHSGNDWISAAAMSSGRGVQLWRENPISFTRYGVDEAQKTVSYYALQNFYDTAMDYRNPTSSANNSNIEKVKRWVMEHGVCSLHYHPSTIYKNTEETLAGVYSKNTVGNSNHAVSLIGWDDAFDFSVFPGMTTRPPTNGAWLIKDSYGEDDAIGGYYWLSYYDTSITSVGSFEMMDAERIDNNYQYTGMIGNVNINPVKAANVFTAKGEETLTRLGIFTVSPLVSYTATVYRGVSGSPESGTLAATVEGVFEHRGYQTIELDTPVSLSTGEKFSVVFALEDIEGYAGDFWFELDGGEFFAGESVHYASSAGESYLYENLGAGALWYDTTNVLLTETQTLGNVMIRAFTEDTDSSVDKTALSAAILRAETEESAGLSNDSGSKIRSELWEIYEANLSAANALMESDAASQQEVDNQTKNLNAILNILKRDREKTISSASELYAYAKDWMSPVNGCIETVKLGDDIVLNPASAFSKDAEGFIHSAANGTRLWTPLGSKGEPYPVEFDGQGHSISGMMVAGGTYRGFFGEMIGTVKNLTLKDSLIYTGTASGSLVGCLHQGGAVENCTVSGVSVIPQTTATDMVGGAVGVMREYDFYFANAETLPAPNIKNVSVTDSLVIGDRAVGGVVGRIFENGILGEDLSFNGRIEARLQTDSYEIIGPVVGRDETKAATYPAVTFDAANTTMRMALLCDEETYSGTLSLLTAPEHKGLESLAATNLTLSKGEREQVYVFSGAPWANDISISATLYDISDFSTSYENGTVTVISPKKNPTGVFLLAARYAGGKLVKAVPIAVGLQNGKQTMNISSQFSPQTGETYKVMLWDLAKVQPLGSAAE